MSTPSPHATAAAADPQASMARAVDFHRSGQLDAAAAIYQEILAHSPRDFDATHLLGVVALQRGQFDSAQGLFNLALSIRPGDPAVMSNLGVSYLRAGRLQEARQLFEKILAVTPDSAPALTNLGSVLLDLGLPAEAIPLARRAHALDPDSYEACNLLGAALFKAGANQEAVQTLEAATRLQPDQADAWANLSTLLRSIGQESLANEYAGKAAALSPDSTHALTALAGMQYDQGRIAEALESYRRLVSMAPPGVDTRVAYAHALLEDGRNEEAHEQLQEALTLRDTDVAIRWSIVLAQLKTVYDSESERAASREAFGTGLQDMKKWYESAPAIDSAFKAVGVSQPFLLAYHPHNNRELLSRYGELCAAFMSTYPLPAAATPGTSTQDKVDAGERKLRLGVVAAHVRNHSVWHAITKGWLQNLDRSRFDVHLFQVDATADEETEIARGLVTRLEDQPRELSAWIQTIRDAELDVILYPEISMHALTLKLACLRLAPVQAVTWGHPDTTGLPTIDLYLSAAALEPANAAANYTERLVTLPNLGVYVEPLAPETRETNLRALRLPRDEPLLLCPGSPFKYSPQYDSVWVEIAQRLGKKTLFRRNAGGRLVFFKSNGEERNGRLETRLRAVFAAAGVDFDSHVSFLPTLARADYFALMRQSALLLDTLSFSGFNTAIQAIECDLPVLAFEGEFMRGRLASGILRQLELPELIATTPGEFVQKAVALARDPAGRKALQAKIVERRGKLFRDVAPVRALESCLLEASSNARRPTPTASPQNSPQIQ